MGVLADIEAAVATVEAAVRDLDPAVLGGGDAARLVEVFAAGEKVCGAGKAIAAGRAADTAVWREAGERSAAHWLARRTGTSVGSAAATLETAARLEELPGTDAAFRSGRLSQLQAQEITAAAVSRPQVESELLAVAQRDTVQGLRDACRQVAAAGHADEVSRHQAIHRGRYVKCWTDPDGAGRLAARLTVADLAQVLAGIEAFEPAVFEAARVSGRREPYHAYQADALVAMARASGGEAGSGGGGRGGPVTHINVTVAHSAFVRGYPVAGETCEIAGVGPVPVATVQEMMADAFLAAVVTDGVDVSSVAHLGRSVTAHQRTALQVRDRHCVIPGCHVDRHLEIDHVDGWADTHITKLDRLARLCHFHHAQKTYEGYRLEGSPGHWQWIPPHYPAADPPPPPPPTVRSPDGPNRADPPYPNLFSGP